MIYKLEIIPGTAKYVKQEVIEKFPGSRVISTKENEINIESQVEDIDCFRVLLSVLRVEHENGLKRNLFRREWKVDSVAAGANPALAYILCKVAEIGQNDTVLDPFCGGGTIALTAGMYLNPIKVFASDLSGKAIDIIQKNFSASKLSKDNFIIFRSNVSMIKLQKNTIDKIVTNLPFGIRVGDHEQNKKTYSSFEKKAASLLKSKGLLVALTQEKNLFEEVFATENFRRVESFMIKQGGLTPWVFVYQKS